VPLAGQAPATALYLALGDSYTISTGASAAARRWPSQLARRLEAATGAPVSVTNLGVGGFTTDDLIEVELPHIGDARWHYGSILIGVNDFYQGFDESHYRPRLVHIYDAIEALGMPPGRVLAVSIPDYSYTPVGLASGPPEEVMGGLQRFNAVGKGEAASRGFTWVDIFDVSRSLIGSPGWISSDDLHPGDIQYQAWAEHIWDAVAATWGASGRPPG
jgi:acyl-CoA thioesterase I